MTATSAPPFRDRTLSPDDRTRDLLQRLDLSEKVNQLRQVLGFQCYVRRGSKIELTDLFLREAAAGVGALYGLLRADPWTKIDLATGLSPRESADTVNLVQKHIIDHTRWGIPLLLAEECPHGLMALGATVMPCGLALASTFNPALARRAAAVASRELRALGATIGYGPVLDLARDPRWSRTEETFGEDPYLAARTGQAFVEGFGDQATGQGRALCTLKHFAAYGESLGGHNGGPVNVGPRELHAALLPAFRAAVRAGAGSVMTSYNEIDGVPCTCDHELISNLLRNTWRFDGLVVSDLNAIDFLPQQRVARDLPHAAALALRAGVDLDLGGNAFGRPLLEALRRGEVTIDDIDQAVARVLRTKFRLGLFENPYAQPDRAVEVVGHADHQQVSLDMARESVVLLTNDGLLPLRRPLKSIAVIGPNADAMYNQLGSYTAPQPRDAVTTVLDGLRTLAGPQAVIRHARGCGIRNPSDAGFADAIAAARASDLAVLVLGSSSSMYADVAFASTGAADVHGSGGNAEIDCGEGFDRHDLALGGEQEQLLDAIHQTGVPIVLVIISGRAVDLTQCLPKARAILQVWYPGPHGGRAVAEALCGDLNPAGRLPVSLPRCAGQLPAYYNPRPHGNHNYVDLDGKPLFGFGFGLSYTTFAYADLRIAPPCARPDEPVAVSVTVTNTGPRAGDEVVQLYLTDEVATVALPARTLRGFQRVHLAPGQSQRVEFRLTGDDLAIVDARMRWTIEPGTFRVRIGGNPDAALEGTFQLVTMEASENNQT